MIKVVGRNEYLQVIGLLALARQAKVQMDAIESSLKEVLKVSSQDYEISGVGDPNHIGDAILSGYTADELLKEKLGLEIEGPQ
jgi:hypothetical protein